MPQTYETADPTTKRLLDDVRKKHHPILHQCGVAIATLFVADIDPETGEVHRTLKSGGYPAAAEIKITPLKQRVLGVADAVLVLDQATWDGRDREERRAVLDHELCHLQVKAADRGFVGLTDAGALDKAHSKDDHGRPTLRMRRHDWQLGGFRAVARRHGERAVEVQQVRAQRDPTGQYAWDFASHAKVDDAVDAFIDRAQRTADKTRSTVSVGTQGETTAIAEPQGAVAEAP